MFSFLKTRKKKVKIEHHDPLDHKHIHKSIHHLQHHHLPPTPPTPPIMTTCIHTIIQDYIDIDPEKGQIIYYCNKCLSTFEKENNTFILQYENSGSPPFY